MIVGVPFAVLLFFPIQCRRVTFPLLILRSNIVSFIEDFPLSSTRQLNMNPLAPIAGSVVSGAALNVISQTGAASPPAATAVSTPAAAPAGPAIIPTGPANIPIGPAIISAGPGIRPVAPALLVHRHVRNRHPQLYGPSSFYNLLLPRETLDTPPTPLNTGGRASSEAKSSSSSDGGVFTPQGSTPPGFREQTAPNSPASGQVHPRPPPTLSGARPSEKATTAPPATGRVPLTAQARARAFPFIIGYVGDRRPTLYGPGRNNRLRRDSLDSLKAQHSCGGRETPLSIRLRILANSPASGQVHPPPTPTLSGARPPVRGTPSAVTGRVLPTPQTRPHATGCPTTRYPASGGRTAYPDTSASPSFTAASNHRGYPPSYGQTSRAHHHAPPPSQAQPRYGPGLASTPPRGGENWTHLGRANTPHGYPPRPKRPNNQYPQGFVCAHQRVSELRGDRRAPPPRAQTTTTPAIVSSRMYQQQYRLPQRQRRDPPPDSPRDPFWDPPRTRDMATQLLWMREMRREIDLRRQGAMAGAPAWDYEMKDRCDGEESVLDAAAAARECEVYRAMWARKCDAPVAGPSNWWKRARVRKPAAAVDGEGEKEGEKEGDQKKAEKKEDEEVPAWKTQPKWDGKGKGKKRASLLDLI